MNLPLSVSAFSPVKCESSSCKRFLEIYKTLHTASVTDMCNDTLFWCDMGPQRFSSSIQLVFLKKAIKNQHTTSYFPCLYPPEGKASSSLSVINTQLLLSMILGINEVCNIKADTRGCMCMQLLRAVLHTTKGRVSSFISLKKSISYL